MKYDERFDPEYKEVLIHSRKLAIACNHYFIGTEHLFVALLQTPCKARELLPNLEHLNINWLKRTFQIEKNPIPSDNIPLTLSAERIIRHSDYINEQLNPGIITTVDLILSILSYQNRITDEMKKKGTVYEDVFLQIKSSPIKKYPLNIVPRKFRLAPLPFRFLGLAYSRKRIMEELVQHATTLYEYQQYRDCIAVCDQGLSLDPANDSLLILLGYSHYANSQFKKAIQAIDIVLKKYPDNIEMVLMKASCHDQLKEFSQSDMLFKRSLKRYPENVFLLNNIGYSFIEQHQYAAAVPYLEKAIKIDPAFAFAYNNLGYCMLKLNEFETAIDLINQSIDLDSGNSMAYKFKAICLLENGQKQAALENLHLALKFGYLEDFGEDLLHYLEGATEK